MYKKPLRSYIRIPKAVQLTTLLGFKNTFPRVTKTIAQSIIELILIHFVCLFFWYCTWKRIFKPRSVVSCTAIESLMFGLVHIYIWYLQFFYTPCCLLSRKFHRNEEVWLSRVSGNLNGVSLARRSSI